MNGASDTFPGVDLVVPMSAEREESSLRSHERDRLPFELQGQQAFGHDFHVLHGEFCLG